MRSIRAYFKTVWWFKRNLDGQILIFKNNYVFFLLQCLSKSCIQTPCRSVQIDFSNNALLYDGKSPLCAVWFHFIIFSNTHFIGWNNQFEKKFTYWIFLCIADAHNAYVYLLLYFSFIEIAFFGTSRHAHGTLYGYINSLFLLLYNIL